MILCDSEIMVVLQSGQVEIVPAPATDHITTSAVGLTLGNEFTHWRRPSGKAVKTIIDPSQPNFWEECKPLSEEMTPDEEGAVIIEPHHFILAITRERVHLPITSRVAARVEGRSSLARLGLGVHVTAPTIHAGFNPPITLELTNQGTHAIRLCPGLRICQLILEMTFGTPSRQLQSIFQHQTSVLGNPNPPKP